MLKETGLGVQCNFEVAEREPNLAASTWRWGNKKDLGETTGLLKDADSEGNCSKFHQSLLVMAFNELLYRESKPTTSQISRKQLPGFRLGSEDRG